MAIQAVVFDIGNVLIGWQPEQFYDQRIGLERRQALFAEVDLHHMNELVDRGEDFRDTIYRTAVAHPKWQEEIRLWHDQWLNLAGPVIDHSVRLLRALRASGVPAHALSNFGVGSFDLAQQHYEFLNEFDVPFISGRLKVTKPSAEIYRIVEERTGLPPSALLFADDRPDNIAAAKARGWQTHLFDAPAPFANRLVAEGLLTAEQAL